MKRVAKFVLTANLISLHAYAGQHVGNGGDAHACYANGQLVSAELYDFYEVPKTSEGIFISLGSEEIPWEQKVELALKRLENLDAVRARRLLARFRSVFLTPQTQDYKFVDEPLPDEPDTGGTGVLPQPGCEIKQAAIRMREVVAPPYEKRFRINRPIFLAMNSSSRAGLVLHELLYEEAIQRGFKNSRRVRWFTAFVSSTLMQAFDPGSYQSLIRRDLFMSDDQLLLDHEDETYLIEYHAKGMSFSDAVDDCSARGGGTLLTGYNHSFRLPNYRDSPLLRSLVGAEWWGELDVSPNGEVSHYVLTRDVNRFFRRGTGGASSHGYMCSRPVSTNGDSRDEFKFLCGDRLCEY